jgi:hypothetical protein
MEAPIQSSSVDGHPLFGSHGSTSAVGAEGYATMLSVYFWPCVSKMRAAQWHGVERLPGREVCACGSPLSTRSRAALFGFLVSPVQVVYRCTYCHMSRHAIHAHNIIHLLAASVRLAVAVHLSFSPTLALCCRCFAMWPCSCLVALQSLKA